MLVHQLKHVVLLLLIYLLRENHLFVVINLVVFALGWFLGLLDCLEDLLYLLLHRINVNVTYDDDSLKVGAIPLLVVVAQSLVWEVVDDLHCTDWQAAAVTATGEDVGEHAFLHAHHCSVASAPLLVDNAAFAVNLLLVKCETIGPVMQYP